VQPSYSSVMAVRDVVAIFRRPECDTRDDDDDFPVFRHEGGRGHAFENLRPRKQKCAQDLGLVAIAGRNKVLDLVVRLTAPRDVSGITMWHHGRRGTTERT